MSGQETAALEAVARRFGATVESGPDANPRRLTIHALPVDVEVADLGSMHMGAAPPARLRLRFDKVALRVINRLRTALNDAVPDRSVALFTLTAPIREPTKTLTALEAGIRGCLQSGTGKSEGEICGNRFTMRVVTSIPNQAWRVFGFVHNPDTEGGLILDMSQALLERFGDAVGLAGRNRDRWLVLAAPGPTVQAWRQVYTQLSVRSEYARVLFASANGRVEDLEA